MLYAEESGAQKPINWAFLSCGRVAHDYANALDLVDGRGNASLRRGLLTTCRERRRSETSMVSRRRSGPTLKHSWTRT